MCRDTQNAHDKQDMNALEESVLALSVYTYIHKYVHTCIDINKTYTTNRM